jgi:hypothetical protein
MGHRKSAPKSKIARLRGFIVHWFFVHRARTGRLRQSVISEGVVQNKKLTYLEQSGILLSSLSVSIFDV